MCDFSGAEECRNGDRELESEYLGGACIALSGEVGDKTKWCIQEAGASVDPRYVTQARKHEGVYCKRSSQPSSPGLFERNSAIEGHCRSESGGRAGAACALEVREDQISG